MVVSNNLDHPSQSRGHAYRHIIFVTFTVMDSDMDSPWDETAGQSVSRDVEWTRISSEFTNVSVVKKMDPKT